MEARAGVFQRVLALGEGMWMVRGHFHLGEGQTEGLKWAGLRDRMLSLLSDGLQDQRLQEGEHNESTKEQLAEERAMVQRLMDGDELPFVLDTTMGIATTGNGDKQLALLSPTPFDEEVRKQIDALGIVEAIVASNLQHWLFLPKWAQAYPDAKIYLAPSALGEDLETKLTDHTPESLPQPKSEWVVLEESGHQLGPHLDQQLLLGAPLNMNEVVFFHAPSHTLVASDSFYGGYAQDESPSWFGRLWFKLTKKAFRSATLPIYRTSRVISHGDRGKLIACVKDIAQRWAFDKIIFAHGTSPYTHEPRKAYVDAWSVLTSM
ncbi:hypothetical protein PTSG_04579 [Salpingoeca rosetta]|uniref:Metallo-beta-lactamase domain-containing protein n=1 Tax=Salpingoeca rosetta (strain ATCC 50818 / BSB-021) TaxID=946362 RepID=F2U7U6_SALR5|nr:uncharacterized protein PTSG_04579 [Salpingoeca rosetta]EGD72851.1 hypothetical protein PTSG_04579 [Salpingoeca rosetta]|eukprot:XP_004994674.1 hypothetical protein PTSG_04579 [Salpingoeca rosetta]